MKEYTPVYTVWRRSDDGYVTASASNSGGAPHSTTRRDAETGELVTVTFEVLLVTKDWAAAHARIRAERVADEMNGTLSS